MFSPERELLKNIQVDLEFQLGLDHFSFKIPFSIIHVATADGVMYLSIEWIAGLGNATIAMLS
jgi:hypothetical protein